MQQGKLPKGDIQVIRSTSVVMLPDFHPHSGGPWGNLELTGPLPHFPRSWREGGCQESCWWSEHIWKERALHHHPLGLGRSLEQHRGMCGPPGAAGAGRLEEEPALSPLRTTEARTSEGDRAFLHPKQNHLYQARFLLRSRLASVWLDASLAPQAGERCARAACPEKALARGLLT